MKKTTKKTTKKLDSSSMKKVRGGSNISEIPVNRKTKDQVFSPGISPRHNG